MAQGVNVDDIDIFRLMKVAVIRFRQTAQSAVLNADATVGRMLGWLENDQLSHWQTQIRKRTEAVTRAREAVRGKKLFKDATGRTPNAAQEEKTLRAALTALEQAEAKLTATKRSIPKLQKEIEVYRGGVQALSTSLITDIPKAIAMLERLSLSMDEYVNMASSSAGGANTLPPADAPASAPEETADVLDPDIGPEQDTDVPAPDMDPNTSTEAPMPSAGSEPSADAPQGAKPKAEDHDVTR